MTTESSILIIKGSFTASVVAFFEYFGLPREPLCILTTLMAIDFITGIAKTYRLKDAITSQKGWLVIMKKMLTLLVIVSLALAIKGTGYDGGFPLSVLVSMTITAELFSIVQNVLIFRTGKNMTEFDATNFVLKKLVGFLENKIQK